MNSKKMRSAPITGTYSFLVTGYDWGAGVNKAVLTMERKISRVDAKDFLVFETKQETDWTGTDFPVVINKTRREVTDAYLCDSSGNRCEGPSYHIALKMYVSPETGSPLLFSMKTQKNSWSDPYFLTFALEEGATLETPEGQFACLDIAREATGIVTSVDMFELSNHMTESGISYDYVSYKPKSRYETLVVWLHGMGEGGTDNSDAYMPVLGNKAGALAGEKFQKTIKNAAILAPQCPTMWMDDGSGDFTAEGSSLYTKSLMELIERHKNECGASKVVLTGCSNGGFMVLEMMTSYPGYFAAGVPICAAKLDGWVSDDDINRLKDQPLYFIYSNDDQVVDPLLYEIPVIERLKNAGAKNLAVATTDMVIDTSGKYTDDKGNPYRYNGHWSWIYFDNNEAFDDVTGLDSWSWIANHI
ncbi:MAG: hypothetical protein PHS94_06190 [Erysipelotrichaceae bacterium]|nr:hypothetical protein [Erysipelotrichaceae bacterium]